MRALEWNFMYKKLVIFIWIISNDKNAIKRCVKIVLFDVISYE